MNIQIFQEEKYYLVLFPSYDCEKKKNQIIVRGIKDLGILYIPKVGDEARRKLVFEEQVGEEHKGTKDKSQDGDDNEHMTRQVPAAGLQHVVGILRSGVLGDVPPLHSFTPKALCVVLLYETLLSSQSCFNRISSRSFSPQRYSHHI